MIIKSNFRDYYDGVARNGADRSIRYIRTAVKSELDRTFTFDMLEGFYRTHVDPDKGDSFYIAYKLIGFCDTLFPLYEFTRPANLGNRGKAEAYFCYSYEHVEDFVAKHLGSESLDYFHNGNKKDRRFGSRASLWTQKISGTSVREWFERWELEKPKYKGLNTRHKCPVIAAWNDSVMTEKRGLRRFTILEQNARLQPYDFMRVKDPVSAYQDIYMWLSNHANPNPTIPHVSDEDLIIAKGFDKFSFRKDKAKK